ncbi:peroxidase family protein [Marmoricola sp. URHB0036]|uniref:peroxidase family protein n=1 Tax=Marmoricola sp. URHB0036 TaxID=1298863 RepID=UPI000400F992|nr:peroxidase family protein [Marmoricola sp. URHB0036]
MTDPGPTHPSSADRPFHLNVLWRAYDALATGVDHKLGWDKLPKLMGLFDLVGIRNVLREHNLHDTSRQPSVGAVEAPEWDPAFEKQRTVDGSWNDLANPTMGMAGTRFGRNVPIEHSWPDTDRMLEPNPRTISRRLMTREELIPASAGNALIAAWLQFMIHDWFRHGTSPTDDPWVLELDPDDDWPEPPLQVFRTPPDPTSPPSSDLPPTYVNTNTHWWDGSQIYGNSGAEQDFLREHEGGRMQLVDGLPPIPDDPASNPTLLPGFWLGLGMMQTLFVHEHNSIATMLAGANPSWDDEKLFQRARVINCALLAKIHTIEWTPAVTAHPTAAAGLHANWYGLAGQKLGHVLDRFVHDEIVTGIPGTHTDHYGVPYALTEEFVAVYRMHPLIPDSFDFRAAADDSATLGAREFDTLTGPAAVDVLRAQQLGDLLYTFGTMNPGVVCLHNYPRYLQTFTRPDGQLMDMASLDVLRCRELGVPRYTAFLRQMHKPVPESFADLTSNQAWARELEEVYDGDLDSVDLLSGMYAEDRPEGFAFSDTAFRIFILMASRRLNSDRFFTDSFTEEVYTAEGLAWLDENTMGSVLKRHCPSLAPYVDATDNAFALWKRPAH